MVDEPRRHSSEHRRDQWIAIGSIAAVTFLLVAAEFLPIGLLSRLASDLQISEGAAGLAVTATGFVAAFASAVVIFGEVATALLSRPSWATAHEADSPLGKQI